MCLNDNQLQKPTLSSPFAIEGMSFRNRVVLAPMSGVTDLPFRQLAWRYGALGGTMSSAGWAVPPWRGTSIFARR